MDRRIKPPPPAALDGFDVRKYDACAEWGAREWRMALSMRSAMRHFLHTMKDGLSKVKLPDPVFSNEREYYLKIAEERLANPLSVPQGAPYLVAPVIIRDLCFSDFFHFDGIAGRAQEAGLDIQAGLRIRDVATAVGLSSDTFYLSLDLSASDLVIKEKFDNWLKITREKSGIKPAFTERLLNESDFKDWHASRLLPFLDLLLWSKLSRYSLSKEDISEKLFPLLFGDVSKIRSAPKNALRLISRANMDLLAMGCQTY